MELSGDDEIPSMKHLEMSRSHKNPVEWIWRFLHGTSCGRCSLILERGG